MLNALFRPILMYTRPNVLQWYVFKEFFKNFCIAMLACGLIGLLGTIVQKSTEFENYGITYGQIAALSPFFLPQAMTYTIPLAVMVAAIMAFGRMAADNEIQAAQSGGASIGMISVFVVFSSCALSAAALWCNDEGIEWGFRSIRERVLNYGNPDFIEALKKPGTSLNQQLENGVSATINMLPHNEDRKPVHIAFFSNDRTVQSFYARHHETTPPYKNERDGLSMKLTLFDCQSLNDDRMSNIHREIALVLDLPALESQFSLGTTTGTEGFMTNKREADTYRRQLRHYQLGTLDHAAELAAQAAAGSPADPVLPLVAANEWMQTRLGSETVNGLREKSLKRYVEYHRKLALSLIPLSMAFLGIGLGLLVRKGNRIVGFVLGLLAYFLVYYPLMIIFKETASTGLVPAWTLWIPNGLVLLLGLWLWRLYNRGYAMGWLGNVPANFWALVQVFWRMIGSLNIGRFTPFRRKADQHVVQSFLAPLLAVALAIGVFIITLDLVEHGNDVVKGVLRADAPVAGPPRSVPQAMLDVVVYYAIRAMSIMFDFMPVQILIAGGLAVAVMVRNNEHVIFKSSGTRLQRVFLPMLLVAGALSVGVTLLRESVMPHLLMEVDRLKPLVYHKNAKTRAMAGQTRDADGRLVIYETALYNRNKHECEFLRIYYIDPEAMTGGRIARVTADRARWDREDDCWRMETIAAETGGGSAAPGLRKPQPPAEGEKAAPKEVRYEAHGYRIDPEPTDDPLGLHANRFVAHKLGKWRGTLSPSFLDSENLGPGVVRLSDLWAMCDHKPKFLSELWRRGFEWLAGILLLMLSIPLLVGSQVRSLLMSVAWCVVIGATYLTLTIAVAELAHQQILPSWAPMLPHVAFLAIASLQYGWRMET